MLTTDVKYIYIVFVHAHGSQLGSYTSFIMKHPFALNDCMLLHVVQFVNMVSNLHIIIESYSVLHIAIISVVHYIIIIYHCSTTSKLHTDQKVDIIYYIILLQVQYNKAE